MNQIAQRRLVSQASTPAVVIRPSVRGAFTFTEIMFAVIILGLGFIMIAAIFPVAIKQGQSSAEETIGISEAQRVITSVSSRATKDLFPPTSWDYDAPGGIYPWDPSGGAFVALGEAYKDARGTKSWMVRTAPAFAANNTGTAAMTASEIAAANQWAKFRGDLLSRVDPRYGVAIAYSRTGKIRYNSAAPPLEVGESDVVKVVAVVAQMRAKSVMNEGDQNDVPADWSRDVRIPQDGSAVAGVNDFRHSDNQRLIKSDGSGGALINGVTQSGACDTPATLQFKRLTANFYVSASTGSGEPDRIRFIPPDNSRMHTGHYSCVAPGAYVIVGDASNGIPTQFKTTASLRTAYNVRANGRVFRIGEPIEPADPATGFYTDWTLVPGQDVSSILQEIDKPPYSNNLSVVPNDCEVLVLGKSLRDSKFFFNQNTNPYVGPAMDVAVYTTQFTLSK